MSNPTQIQELRGIIGDETAQRPTRGIIKTLGANGGSAVVSILQTGQTIYVSIPVGMRGAAVGDMVYLSYFGDDVVGLPVATGGNTLAALTDTKLSASITSGSVLYFEDTPDHMWKDELHAAITEVATGTSSFSGASYASIQSLTLTVPASAIIVALFTGRWQSDTVNDTIELYIKLDSGTRFKTDRAVDVAGHPDNVSTHGIWNAAAGSHTVAIECAVGIGTGTGSIYDRKLSVFTLPIPALS